MRTPRSPALCFWNSSNILPVPWRKVRDTYIFVNLINSTGIWRVTHCLMGFPGGTSDEESACQYRRCKSCRIDPWVRKISWRKKWHPNSLFLPGKFHEQSNLVGYSPWGHRVRHDWARHWLIYSHHLLTPTFLLWCFCVFQKLGLIGVTDSRI